MPHPMGPPGSICMALIPRIRRMPINKQDGLSLFAVGLGEVLVGIDLVAPLPSTDCLAIHDDLVGRILYFTDGPLARGERTKGTALSPECDPVPVRIWECE